MKKTLKNERGAALIIAIMAMVIMTTLIIEFAYNTRVDISMLSNYRSTQQGRYFAEVGVEAAKILLLSDLERDDANGTGVDYYAYDASRETEQQQQQQQGGGLASGLGGGLEKLAGLASGGELEEVWSLMTAEMQPLPLGDTGAQVKIVILDESGKVNLNSLDVPRGVDLASPLAKRWLNFFKAVGIEEQDGLTIIPNLIDWIDRNDDESPQGHESSFYQQLDPPYMTRNGVLFGLEELRLIEGIKPENWAKLGPFVTVFPQAGATQSKLNINTASKEAMQFLDPAFTDETAQAVIDARNKAPFKSDSEFGQVLNGSGAPDLYGRVMSSGFTLRSDTYSVRSSALVNDVEFSVYAIIRRQKGTKEIKTLYWRAE